jgi:hypothetical protein
VRDGCERLLAPASLDRYGGRRFRLRSTTTWKDRAAFPIYRLHEITRERP